MRISHLKICNFRSMIDMEEDLPIPEPIEEILSWLVNKPISSTET